MFLPVNNQATSKGEEDERVLGYIGLQGCSTNGRKPILLASTTSRKCRTWHPFGSLSRELTQIKPKNQRPAANSLAKSKR